SQPVFNTNNIWVSVKHLMDSIQSGSLSLDLIRNKKSTSGAAYVQLEYAMGSAIKSFPNAKAMIVPRSRFFPIKKTNDLLLLLSDYCNWTSDGQLVWDDTLNVDVELSAPFDTVAGFFQYFHKIPSIKSARSIRIQGPIIFDQKVRLFDHVNLLLNSNLSSSISSFFNDFQNVELISD
ncbi:MAG: UTP--glucose-1-phosphate uridylyltransferase, partial [Candidatus Margulisiibacteriota bacterium]